MTDAGTGPRVALLAPMPSELRPLVRSLSLRRSPGRGDGDKVYEGQLAGVAVVAAMTGIGMAAGARAAERVLDAGAVQHLVVVGVAGGVDDRLRIGQVIVPEVVIDGSTGREYRPHPLGDRSPAGLLHTSDDLILDPGPLASLMARGVVALDMETAAIAAVCERRGCPWSVFRAISDRVTDGMVDTEVAGLARPDGSPNLPAVARLVMRHPGRIPQLARLGRDLRTASQAAAAAAIQACGDLERRAGNG